MIPQARANDRRYFGVVEAIVTDVNDPEKEGRIRVKFPWFDPDMESDWCPLAQPYAGAGQKGWHLIPDVDDLVLVAFIHGDMTQPVAIACLCNGVDKPPTHRDDSRDQKMLRTRAGHEILLDDTAGEERVRIVTQGGHTLDLNDKEQRVVVQTSGGQSVILDETGAVTIKGSQSVTVDAPKVNLGPAAVASLVLGEQMLVAFNTHVHTCTAPATPSSPPVVPMAGVLSTAVKTS